MVGTPLKKLKDLQSKKSANKLIDKFAKIFLIFLAIALALAMAASGVYAPTDSGTSTGAIRLTPIERYDISNWSNSTNSSTTPIVLKPILVNLSEEETSTGEMNATIPTNMTNVTIPVNVSSSTRLNISENITSTEKVMWSDSRGIYPEKDARLEGERIIVGKNVTWSTVSYGDKVTIPSVAYGLAIDGLEDEMKASSGKVNLTISELMANMERISRINSLESELNNLKIKRTRQNIIGRTVVDMNSFGIENSIRTEKERLLNITEPVTIRFKTNATRTIHYTTEAPKKTETNITGFRKYVNISSIMHYTNVTAYTDLAKEVSKNKIEIYWIINGTRVAFKESEHSIRYLDTNDNGLIDRIEWVVPHLSSQVFEIITRMSSVYDMDEMKNPLSDIYSLVKTIDNVSAEINDTHHVGITFEKPLDNTNSIIIYANTSAPEVSLSLYNGGKDAVVILTNITSYGRYIFSLENMTEVTDQFFIKVTDGTLYIDYITSYPAYGNATIWDDTNDVEGKNEVYYENEVTGFYANATNSSGQPLNDSTSNCRIAFNISGSWTAFNDMSYNSTSKLYEYFTSFPQAGTFDYNVSCNASSGSSMITDNFTINQSMPDYTMLRDMIYDPTTDRFNITLRIISRTDHRYTLNVYDYLEKGFIGENYSITPSHTGNYSGDIYDGRYMIWTLPLSAHENKTITYLARINSTIARTDALFGMG